MSMLRTFALITASLIASAVTTNAVLAQGLLSNKGNDQRKLAIGVLTEIAPNIGINEGVVYPRPFPGLTIANYKPNFTPDSKTLRGQTSGVVRYRDVWQLDFAFKDLRHTEVSLPLPGGKSQIAEVWYLIYRVRNLDKHLSFPKDPETGETTANSQTPLAQLDENTLPGRFFPSLLLEGWVEDAGGNYSLKAYRDSILPAAVEQIAAEERLVGRLNDGFSIAKQNLPTATSQSEGVWGVATWIDLDPRINFATISVQGLSNAFRSDQDGAADDNKHRVKTLQLNFWRPGDSTVSGDNFKLGIPYDEEVKRQVSLLKRYRLPGPDLVIERINSDTGAPIEMGRVSAEYDLETLKSSLIGQLDGQQTPEQIAQFLATFGYTDDQGLNVSVATAGKRWTLEDSSGNQFIVVTRPITWKVNDEKIDFVGPLDSFWDFRYIY